MEKLFGYILFITSGILFGLFGAGGSLITIPILMFFFDLSFKISTTYSLIIVFLVSFFGLISSSKSVIYKFKSILSFGFASLCGVFLSRNFLFQIASEELLIKIFVSFLFFSGSFMFLKEKFMYEKNDEYEINIFNYILLIFQGFLVGNLTGLLGLGGGFLIVPILIIFQKFNIKQAAKASIFLIFLNSWFSIIIDFSTTNSFHFDLQILIYILFCSIIGFLIGKKTQQLIDIKMTYKLFAIFLIVISLFIGFNIKLFL